VSSDTFWTRVIWRANQLVDTNRLDGEAAFWAAKRIVEREDDGQPSLEI
jgi:hypothetical protein